VPNVKGIHVPIDLVVVGLGYVGLPLAHEASLAGIGVVGFDVSSRVVHSLNSGHSHVDDLSNDDIAGMIAAGFYATDDPSVFSDAAVVVICVPTPLSPQGGPDLAAVEGAARTVAQHVHPGQLIVLESTTYPGTTEEVVAPILEQASGLKAGTDFDLAFSPERIDPGNATFGLRNTPKVVGGVNEASTQAAAAFYSKVVDEVVTARGTREAEAAKLLENTYRHLNIALVNEMARVFHKLDIDVWDVVRLAATKPFGFQAFYPGPGVGGHCIPIDPNYLSHHVRNRLGEPFRLIELAQEINISAPNYVAERAQELLEADGVSISGAKVLLLGVTYKPNIADERESPAVDVAAALMARGADISYHDPRVATWHVEGQALNSVADLDVAVRDAALVIVIQNHREYNINELAAASARMLDTRGVADSSLAEHL
jgi:UDP-N-acetyl-D-glucosamine dehydrogenase